MKTKGSHHFLKNSKELREFLAMKGIAFQRSDDSTNLYVHDLTSQQVFDLGIEYGNLLPQTDNVLNRLFKIGDRVIDKSSNDNSIGTILSIHTFARRVTIGFDKGGYGERKFHQITKDNVQRT